MHRVQGGCQCGNITYLAELSHSPSFYHPRSCSCDFCTSHNASYVSDKSGTLKITIQNPGDLIRYRQGSRLADFLICRKCGVMTGVCYEENTSVYASINVCSTDEYDAFAESEVAHLTQQSDEERIRRWKDIWFANVVIEYQTLQAAD